MNNEVNDDVNRTGLVIGLLVGIPFMIIGVKGLLHHTDATPPANYLRFVLGGNIIHDAIVAPIAGVAGWLLIKHAPAIARAPLRAALFGTVIVLAIAWPALRGYGRMRAPDNLTVQPLNYATAVWTALAVVWVVSATWLGVAVIRAKTADTVEA